MTLIERLNKLHRVLFDSNPDTYNNKQLYNETAAELQDTLSEIILTLGSQEERIGNLNVENLILTAKIKSQKELLVEAKTFVTCYRELKVFWDDPHDPYDKEDKWLAALDVEMEKNE